MNPKITFSEPINGASIQSLLYTIKETTGLLYGYMPQEMVDTQFTSVILTQYGKGKKRIKSSTRAILHATVIASCIGFGLSRPRIEYP